MSGGIGVDVAVVGVGLELVLDGAGCENSRLGHRQVVDIEIKVQLLRNGSIRPGRWLMGGHAPEVDAAAGTANACPSLVSLGHRSAGDPGVERGELGSVRGNRRRLR